MPIRTEQDYRRAVVELQRLERATPDTPEFDRRHELLAQTAQYEQRHQLPPCTKRPGGHAGP